MQIYPVSSSLTIFSHCKEFSSVNLKKCPSFDQSFCGSWKPGKVMELKIQRQKSRPGKDLEFLDLNLHEVIEKSCDSDRGVCVYACLHVCVRVCA